MPVDFYKGAKNFQWQKNSLFIKWWWENLIPTYKRMKLEPSLMPYIKINSKWSTGVNLSDSVFSKSFFNMTSKVETKKRKRDKLKFVKIKSFCASKDTIKWKDNPRNRRKQLQIRYLIRHLYTKYAYCSTVKRRIIQFFLNSQRPEQTVLQGK